MDRASLIARLDAGETFVYRFFWGHRAAAHAITDACFSQWWPCSFAIDGVTYSSAEQWMMAGKARLFGDEQVLAEILATTDPQLAKKLGRKVRGFDEDTWSRARFDLVVRGNVAKFSQNARMKKHLLATGDEVLVEASPFDRVWGIGLSRDAEDARDPRRWRGENLLGFALMQARASLR